MSTTEYLSKLNLDQLRFAKEAAERLIKGFEEQECVTLYVVQGSVVNEACFSVDEFKLAKLKLCDLIMSDDFKEHHVNHRNHPRIIKYNVYESEVPEYMKLNT